jgi:hypothetical protein
MARLINFASSLPTAEDELSLPAVVGGIELSRIHIFF